MIKNIKATRKQKVLLGLIFVVALTLFLVNMLLRVAIWVNYHEFVFADKIVEFHLSFNRPITIVERKPDIIEVYVGQDELNKMVAESENPGIAEYIVRKFGPVEGIKALAIAKAESGLREDAMNLNEGRSLDYGIFQINSIHWSKPGCALKDLVDPYKNVDCAYQIYEQQGFSPWVAYWNNSYLAFLK
jgi:hypothetical protein